MARTLQLSIEEEPGTEIVLRLSCSMATYFEFVERWDGRKGQSLTYMLDLFRDWGDRGFIESWTYQEPTNGAGLVALDWPIPTVIFGRWLAEVGNVPVPLLVTASDGTPSTSEAGQPG